jgi:hypothetical protein
MANENGGELNPFKIAQRQLDKAAAVLGLDPAIHAFLREPLRELHVTLPVKMDDGSTGSSRVSAFNITMPAARQRVVSASTLARLSILCARWQHG